MNMFGYIGYGPDLGMMVFMLPGILLGFYAQMKLRGAYSRYSEVPTHSGISGAEAAREILDRAGLSYVPIEAVPGDLTDHYDPTRKALFLSEENYHGRTLSAIGVAAHEAGHALQHQAAYFPLHFRMTLVPVTNIASALSGIFIMAGFFMHFFGLIVIGIIAFSLTTIFQLVTLPVEFDASRRAKEQLLGLGIVRGDEEAYGVKKVLSAAAMTYVAALVTSALQLLYFVLRFSGMRSSERES